MDWNKGFSARYYACFVEPQTWRDIERFEIKGGTLQKFDSGLRNSATIECVNYQQSTERWVRVWLNARQAGYDAHIPLFTGLATAPERNIDGQLVTNSLACYSVLKPAQDKLLPLGYYAPAKVNGAQIVQQLLSDNTPVPVRIVGESPLLSQHIIAENNENNLSMAEKVLSAINWRLRVLGDGTVEVCSVANSVSARFDALENDSIEPQLRAINDWYGCPNVFRSVMGDEYAIARDESTSSPLSTVNRGREVWMEERDCKLSDGESLENYAHRRLQEEQRRYLAVSYDRRFRPDVIASDIVQLHYPAQDIDGAFYILSQSIEIGYGARTSEEVIQV